MSPRHQCHRKDNSLRTALLNHADDDGRGGRYAAVHRRKATEFLPISRAAPQMVARLAHVTQDVGGEVGDVLRPLDVRV